MSKTFKANGSTVDDRVLEVGRWQNAGIDLSINSPGRGEKGIVIPEPDAPALALAILEAAGHKGASSSSCLMQAFDLIEQHVTEEDAKAKEAADREALEREAWELFKACHPETTGTSLEPGFTSYAIWTSVARKAREIHGAQS